MITLYKRFNKKTERAAEKYRSAWRALCVLDPGGMWSTQFKELKKEDISGPGKDPDDTSNSRYQPSWIWLVPRVVDPGNTETMIGEDEFKETMRVEWSKAQARMRRWSEELLIIQEEMRRVLVYQKWKAGWWRERSSLRDHGDVTILSGISGYAYKQEAICLRIAEKCAVEWLPHLKARGVIPGWASEYEHLVEEGSAFDNSTDGIERPEKVQLNGGEEDGEEEIDYEDNEEESEAEMELDNDDDEFDFRD